MSAPVRVSDAGRLRDGGAGSAAGVRKPPRDETAHKVGETMQRVLWGFRAAVSFLVGTELTDQAVRR